ncbi:hypothetical protein QFZ82_000397 [Streptomyces sp. V4I23]|uniref:hypothetical protein n=1 Tax=Streptomyces sp. V4I23 TaxID=3042282 RepID=UPI0027855713|nr:hypothetical protein [Streptomyces sp. V4I23]MDQ1005912.1 hypothetical protein [Streptomyces sp. V4I23]
MSIQKATDQMIRLARLVESHTKEAHLARFVAYADNLYCAARNEIGVGIHRTSSRGDLSSGSVESAEVDVELLIDAALDSTPLGMAYRAVLGRAWYKACD